MTSELERLREYARRSSIVLSRWSGGGSEMFERIGDEYYATPALCEERARHRERMIERLREAKVALKEPVPLSDVRKGNGR